MHQRANVFELALSVSSATTVNERREELHGVFDHLSALYYTASIAGAYQKYKVEGETHG